jgi:hypothetical protein
VLIPRQNPKTTTKMCCLLLPKQNRGFCLGNNKQHSFVVVLEFCLDINKQHSFVVVLGFCLVNNKQHSFVVVLGFCLGISTACLLIPKPNPKTITKLCCLLLTKHSPKTTTKLC